jgi:hypothetical protein
MSTATANPLAGWPSRGYEGPQPWDHDALGIPRELRESVGSKPNRVTPTISHPYPILTSGSQHACVHIIGRKLGDLGFASSVSQGRNPFGAVDPTVLAAVISFRQAYNVEPDPYGFGGNTRKGRENAENHLDPWTVEAILRAWARENA